VNNQPQLCCQKCGSLNVNPGMPDIQKKIMQVYCNDCKQVSEVNIKIEGVTDDGKLQVTYIPTLIGLDHDKDRIKKFF